MGHQSLVASSGDHEDGGPTIQSPAATIAAPLANWFPVYLAHNSEAAGLAGPER
jgi:hypothetical protein